ncbi:hypothetical protein ES702_04671 [subsurface metagenome]
MADGEGSELKDGADSHDAGADEDCLSSAILLANPACCYGTNEATDVVDGDDST